MAIRHQPGRLQIGPVDRRDLRGEAASKTASRLRVPHCPRQSGPPFRVTYFIGMLTTLVEEIPSWGREPHVVYR
jgi:hypothetical protein